MSLVELGQSQKASTTAVWGDGGAGTGTAEQALHLVKALLEENEGMFIQGSAPSFADFILVGCFRCFELLDQNGDLFGRVMGIDERFREHYKPCRPWLEREDLIRVSSLFFSWRPWSDSFVGGKLKLSMLYVYSFIHSFMHCLPQSRTTK